MQMSNLYNLNKKGTIIITIGRSGSHLLGNIVEILLKDKKIPVINYKENFLNYECPISKINNFYKTQSIKLDNSDDNYIISQIQDFQSKLWLLQYGEDWLKKYHVVVLKRKDKINHFFSRQLLTNFYSDIPIHTIKGHQVSFDNLIGKHIQLSEHTVWQFYSEIEILNRFDGDETVYYEDIINYPEVNRSIYIKNQYPVNYEKIFLNYMDIVTFLNYEK
jgi:hypothetical protein